MSRNTNHLVEVTRLCDHILVNDRTDEPSLQNVLQAEEADLRELGFEQLGTVAPRSLILEIDRWKRFRGVLRKVPHPRKGYGTFSKP